MTRRRESSSLLRPSWRSVARSTPIRSENSKRRQSLSRRKLLLETLENRQLLAVDGLGLTGDSLTDEYINEPYGVYAENWVSLVGQYRSDELPLGEYRPTTISPPDSFDAPWGDLRRAGYEYNWALAGANSFTLLDPNPVPPLLPNPTGQHILLAQAINAGDVSHAVLAIGQNDFSPNSVAYASIYTGSWDLATIQIYSNQVLANIEQALETINVNDVKLVMSNIIDYGVAPQTQSQYPDSASRARVSFHIEALNDRIEALAREHRVPIIDSSRFAKDLLGTDSFTFGGVEIFNDPGQAPNNAFVADGIHPHTITSSLIANGYLNAVNVVYGEDLTLFTEQEVLGFIPELSYTSDTFSLDYNQYLLLPGPDIPPELLLHSNPNSKFKIFLDFDGNVTTGTPWNTSDDPYFVDQRASISFADIRRVWQIVAEDFAPFDVDVTTEEPGSEALRKNGPDDTEWGVRVVIMDSDVHDFCFGTCGGLGGIGSFDASVDTPVYTFTSFPFSAGNTSSHEIGHALTLGHHGNDDQEYYPGHDGGTGVFWNAIMGGGSSILSQWSDGGYFDASNSGQDDLAIITTQNGFGYRVDDHQEELEFATPLRITNSKQVTFSGIIERSDDMDAFSVEHGGGPLQLEISPFLSSPNLDVWAGLYDANGDLIYQPLQLFNPFFPESPSPQVPAASPGLSVLIDQPFLPAGKYFLKVDGVGSHALYDAQRDRVWDPGETPALPPFGEDPEFDDPWTEDPAIGYSDYASLGQYWISGTIVPPTINTINIEATDAIKAEGNTGDETNFVFTLTRNGPLDAATNVDYIVIPALPRNPGDNYRHTVDGEDFRSVGFPLGLPSGFATFVAGAATTNISITVSADTDFEPDEYFEVLLFEPIGESVPWTFQNSSAIGVIQSDENQFYIKAPTIETIVQPEGDDLGSNFVGATYDFTVYRNGYFGAVDSAITVPWTVGSTAFASSPAFSPSSPADFVDQNGNRILDAMGNRVFPSGKVIFSPGETEKVVTIYAKADRVFEMDEAFQLILGTPSYTTTSNPGRPLSVHSDLGKSFAAITNEDIVAAPTLSVEAQIAEIYENGDVLVVQQEVDLAIATRVTITRDGDILDNPTVITVSLSPDSADQAFLMIGPPVGVIDPARDGAKSINIPFGANQEFFDNLYVVSVDDDLLDGTQVATIIATADDHITGVGTVLVHDRATALDRYIAKADDSYRYELVDTIVSLGATTYIIDMTSQTWRTAEEVDNPVWQHWVQIIVPNNAISETAVLVIGGGSRSDTAPTQPDQAAVLFALQTNQVTVLVPTVPNQALIFSDDPNRSRSEDAIIAYSYDKYLDVNSVNRDEWPALLPMVKSAVRAMDTAQDFLGENSDPNIDFDIEDFFVTGASKRGWTTWLTAAVDDRVSGIAPAVIDVLNMSVSMMNHKENYEGVTEAIVGGYARAVQDYTGFNIFDRFDTPEGRALGRIVDPYQYRDRYADIPKYIVNSTGDQFFTPDSSLWYFDDLPGEKYLWYVPNTDHGLNGEAVTGIATFVVAQEAGIVLPEISWDFEGQGKNTLRVNSDIPPAAVRLWQATRTDSIDFRQETNAPPYTSTLLLPNIDGDYVGTVPIPTTGGTAFFVELTYIANGQVLKFTTQASIAEPPSPTLVSVNPGVHPIQDSDLALTGLNVLQFAPQDLTFHFNSGLQLASNLSGIQIFASGGDNSFGNGNDIRVTPDSIEIQPDGFTVVATFAQPLPEDRYRIVITGEDDFTSGVVGLRNFNGDPFQAGDGSSTEVIDFDVNVIYDFGDAPTTYGTLLGNNGARHAVQPWQLPRLGPLVDTEANGQPGNQDDLSGVDDEDGIAIGTYTVGGTDYEVFTKPGTDPSNVLADDIIGFLNPVDSAGAMANVRVFGEGFLSVWVDFDQSGTFDADELAVNGLAVSGDETTGTPTLVNIQTPSDALDGPTWMRVRISDTPVATPLGQVIGGEVEDYRVDVISIQPLLPDDDAYTIDEDITLDTLSLGLLSIADGDTINDGTFGSISFTLDQPPQHGSIVIDPATGHFVYQPNPDFNGVDTFSYRLGSSLATPVGTVTINVNPINDAPEFDIDAPMDGGVATLTILESDDPAGVALPGFAFNIEPGPSTALDEQASQQVSFTISDVSVPDGLMVAPPQLTPDGRLVIFPAANAVGWATYLIQAEDADPGDLTFVPQQTTREFTIHIQPVNDVPGTEISGVSEILNADEAYSVADTDNNGDQLIDPVITYTLREDNIQDGGAVEPFFIPLIGASTAGYDRIGLLDVFNVGPANEQDASLGGSQSLELVAAGIGSGPLTNPRTTDRGGTLTAVFAGGVLTGFNYVPPINFNTESGGLDSFTYQIRDDGVSFNLVDGTLEADPKSRTNQVLFQLNPVNDPPVFTITTSEIVIQEDSEAIEYPNFVIDLGGGPTASAFDENDIQTLNALLFTFTPLDFDAADMGTFFTNPPVIDLETGELSFRTATNVFGSYRFEIRLVDNGASDPVRGDVNTSAPQTLTIHVLPVNDPPTVDPAAATLEYTLPEEGSVEILIQGSGGVAGLLDAFAPGPLSPLADESADVTPGGNQTVSLGSPIPTTTTQGGTLQFLTTGGAARLLYTPRANFSGIDSFVYVVTDDGVTVDLSGIPLDDPRIAGNTVTLHVTPVNDAPIFSLTAVVNSSEDAGPVSVASWATNVQAGPTGAADEVSGPNAQGLSFSFVQTSGNPNLMLPGSLVATIDPATKLASLSYETAPNQNGTAVFEVSLIDDGPSDPTHGDQNVSVPKTFTINVAAVNDPPSFSFISNDPVTLVEDRGPFSTTLLENISPGPNDESGQTVSFVVQPLAPEFAALFSSLPTVDAAGVLRFTTAPNRNTDNLFGPVPVRIIARDSDGGQTGSFGFQIVVTEVNDRPVANANSIDTDEDTILTFSVASLLSNDVDPDLQSNANETLTIRLPQQSQTSSGAQLSYNPQTGQITYDPTTAASIQSLAQGQTRTDSFTYSLIDAAGLISNTVTVSIQIDGINDAPTTVPDTPQLEPSGSTLIRVLDNDSDIDGTINPSSLLISAQPALGTVSVTDEGVIIYTPFGDFTGVDTFSYTVADNLGLRSAPSTVTISANASPIVRNDSDGTFVGEPIRIDVAANDEDSDGLDLTSIVIVRQPARGQAIPQTDGTVLYVPNADFTGNDSFTYQISDQLGRASGIATVTTQVVASRLQNPTDFADVNGDGKVTAIDALLIINLLSRMGNVSEIPVVETDRGPNYYDVSGNQVITAADALRVVNALRLQNSASEAQAAVLSARPLPLAIVDRIASATDDTAPATSNLIQIPAKKIVDVADPPNDPPHLVEALNQRNELESADSDAIIAAIDAVMAGLL